MIDYMFKQDEKNHNISKHNLKILYKKITDYFDNCEQFGLQLRDGQYNMALSVFDAIEAREHLIIEAGVGIGKSYAYLIPLMFYYSLVEKSFIISTSTIALQEQLEKDIHKLSQQLNIPINITVAKGMSNFICLNRLDEYLKNNNKSIFNSINTLKQDRKDYPNIKDKDWNNINVQKCLYSKCSNCDNCEFYKRRMQMQHLKGAIICNHDLLIEDLSRRNSFGKLLFQTVDFIVCDEAHNLESKVRSANTKTINFELSKKVIGQAIKRLEKINIYDFNYQKIVDVIDKLSKIIDKNVNKKINKLQNKGIDIGECNGLSMVFNDNIISLSRQLYDVINDIINSLYMHEERDMRELENALNDENIFFKFLSQGINGNYLFWIEHKRKKILFTTHQKGLIRNVMNCFLEIMTKIVKLLYLPLQL